jgi:hypothetical protein
MHLEVIKSSELSMMLGTIEPLIESALSDTDTITVEQAIEKIYSGEFVLLMGIGDGGFMGIYVLSFSEEANGSICMIVCAAGRGMASQDAFDSVCAYAKEKGAGRIMALAKKSAARLYERVGFKEKTSIMEKILWAA